MPILRNEIATPFGLGLAELLGRDECQLGQAARQ